MKLAIAGTWRWPIYQEACADALESLGVEVVGFSWETYFKGVIGRFEAHTLLPLKHIPKLNRELLKFCIHENPDAILIWGCMHLYNSTLVEIKKRRIVVVSYNNDNPFGSRDRGLRFILHKNIWRNFKKNLPLYDHNFVYRSSNLEDYKKAGLKNVHVLPSYYVPTRNFPLSVLKSNDYDGVFIGHYEDDERADVIVYLRNHGLKVDVYGVGWERLRKYPGEFAGLKPLVDRAYNEKINSAKFALCFFSKLNVDDYTRRVFEITAAGTLLVAPRTAMMTSLFVDGEEAIFFDSAADALARLSALLQDSNEMRRIAINGHRRCLESGYDVKSRMRDFLRVIT